jgi:3-ketosteroid 9alpha-monooxygenase subunit B
MSSRTFHRIRVAEVIEETADTRSLVLDVPGTVADAFAYRPGQFLTVRIPGEIARCYSLSSDPASNEHVITVKRVPGGAVSNWICDTVGAGTVLDVLPPAGSFTPDSLNADLLLIAGGSGITPVMSIIRAVLGQGSGHLMLVYANRDEPSVIFAAALRELEKDHPDRLVVRHWIDREQGPPTADALRMLVEPYAGREAFVCGPEPYMDLACTVLDEVGVPHVHVERFQVESSIVEVGAEATAEVTIDGRTHRLVWPAGHRLLDVIIDAGLNPPYSCRQGLCGACACRLLSGDVDLVHNEILEDEDFADGYILACQAVPRSSVVSVTYA